MKRYARAAGLAVVTMVTAAGTAWAAGKPSFDCDRAKNGNPTPSGGSGGSMDGTYFPVR